MGVFDIFRKNSVVATQAAYGAAVPGAISDALVAQGMANNGYLGPGTPLTPVQGYSGNPRAMDYPVGVNMATASRQQWGRTSYEVLREMLRAYGVAQACMNHKIDEIRSMEPMFTPMDGATGDTDLAVEAAKTALSFPDREHSYDEWIALWLTNLLTFDSGPLKRRRDMNGDIIGLEVIDGSTIYPYVDKNGRRPKAPAPAYFQVIKGQPYMEFTAEDIIFSRFRPQTDSPFGMAPLESILVTVNTDLRYQWHLLQMFTEGSIPGGFLEVPPDVSSPDQVAEWQDYWDSTVMGDQSIMHKLLAVPNGTKVTGTAPATFDPNFPKFLAIQTAAAFGVVPQDLGLTDDVNRATGETQTDMQFRVNTLPWVRFVESHLNRYLQHDLGLPVQVNLNTGRDKEDRLAEAQAWQIYIASGMASMDEAREEILGLPTDNLRPIPRGIISPRLGFVPLESILAISGPVDTETKSPADNVPLSETPFAGTPGLMPDKQPGGTVFTRAPIDPDEPAFPVLEHSHPETSVVAPPAPASAAPTVAKSSPVTVAGVAVKAADTGRVLMIQRTLDPDDPAAGTWEFPGGHLNDGESAYVAAVREWEEETGATFPGDAVTVGSWSSPDGHYAGFVCKISAEGSVPIHTGNGEDGETLAWFHPDDLPGFPALRDELAATLPAEELAKAQDAELVKFRTFQKARKRKGSWRDFQFTTFTKGAADILNAQGRATITKAPGPDDAAPAGTDASPKVGTPKWRQQNGNPTPQQMVDLKVTDHYTPEVQQALADLWSATDLAAAQTATNGLGDVAVGVYQQAVRAVLSGSVNTGNLTATLQSLWQDAYTAGIASARSQVENIPVNWDNWTPGAAPSEVIDSPAWKAALDAAQVTVKDVTDTTMDRIGSAVANGFNNGQDDMQTARDINAFLDDPGRAELIAHTETARMLNQASMDTYTDLGATSFDLITSADACDICMDQEQNNPHPLDDPDAQVPLHPRCRCSSTPHIDDTSTPQEDTTDE